MNILDIAIVMAHNDVITEYCCSKIVNIEVFVPIQLSCLCGIQHFNHLEFST